MTLSIMLLSSTGKMTGTVPGATGAIARALIQGVHIQATMTLPGGWRVALVQVSYMSNWLPIMKS